MFFQKVKEIWERGREDIQRYWKAAVAFAMYMVMVQTLTGRFCPMVLISGLPCPGCGMTRAFFLVLQLRFAEAYQMHPLVYGWIALGIVFCVRRYGMGKEVNSLKKYAIALLAAMVVLYIYRMIRFFPDQEPMTYFQGNLLQRIRRSGRSNH
ncbi:MAG: DUF2752 domain-containing protein [Eubacteriales bacterium]|nr:DUF2752 domain-containing protein [Eubacteriales bacterium]